MNALVKKLIATGLIEERQIGFDQVYKNLKRSIRDIKDAKDTLEINPELTFNCAYNAMLHAGRALMFSFGFRPKDGQQHLTVVEFSSAILGNEFKNLINKYNKARQKRNKFIYEVPDWSISKQEALNTLETAKEFLNQITKIIEKNNPQLNLKF